MKKLLLLAMLMTSIGLAAKGKELSSDYPRHSLEVTVGDPLMADWMSSWISKGVYYGDIPKYRYDKADIWTGNYTIPYTKSRHIVPALNLTYHYAVRNWLHIGPKVSYYMWRNSNYDKLTGNHLYSNGNHHLALMADVRFQYFNRPNVRLYSAASLGIGLGVEHFSNYANIYGTPAWQATLFGLSAGRKAYFNMELGAGVEGFGKIGLGYRF